MQKILVEFCVNNLTFKLNNFKFNEAKFLHNCFWQNLIVYMVFRVDIAKNIKIVNFTYCYLYAFRNC